MRPAAPGPGREGSRCAIWPRGSADVLATPKVASIDLVEVDPEADRDGLTLDAMAHLMLSAVAGYAERE